MFVAFELDTKNIYRVNNFANDPNVKGNNNNDKKFSDLLTKLQLKDKNNNNVSSQIIDENNFVGYLYSEDLEDGVIILPKIYKGKNDNLGIKIDEYSKTINFNSKEDSENFSQFISDLCATLRHFKDRNPNGKSSTKNYEIESKVFSPGDNNEKTLLEIEDSLIDFHKKNKYLFTQIALSKINKSHKINWTKTVTNKQPLIQNKKVVYPELYTQKKEIDYKEELIVLFYSVLNYLKQRTHRKHIEKAALNYKLLSIEKIKQFRENDKGINYLKSIRSRYFSDRLVKLWKLLYAYFSKVYNLKNINNKHKDYLLVNNFEMVFEDMVEQLIGCSDIELKKLNEQKIISTDEENKYKLKLSSNEFKEQLRITEGHKCPDHIYENEKENIFCIADSKYRPLDNFYYSYYDIKKQFDYAKIIKKGANIDNRNIYNFFICPDYVAAEKDLIKDDGIKIIEKTFIQYKYEGDSEPFNLMVFEINFLSLLKSYIKNNTEYNLSVRGKINDKYEKELKNQGNYKKPEYIIGIGNAISDIFNYLQNIPYSSPNNELKDKLKELSFLLKELSFYDTKDAISNENFDEMKNSNKFIEVTEFLQENFPIEIDIGEIFYDVEGKIQEKYKTNNSETQTQ